MEESVMKIYDVKINGMKNPVGYIFDILTCSWKIKDVRGKHQKYVRIEVGNDAEFSDVLYIKEGEQLDSLSETLNMELNPYTRYYVRVMVETDENETAVSETVYFETAKMEENWSAEWIGVQD